MNTRCPYCGNIVPEDFKFCDKCGVQKDDTFEYVPDSVAYRPNTSNGKIKESFKSSIIKFIIIFALYFFVVPNAVAFIYVFLAILLPDVFKDPTTLSDSKYLLLNMALGEIANLIVLLVIFIIITKSGRIKEFFGPKKETKGKTLASTLLQGLITFGCMYGAMYIIAIFEMIVFPSGGEEVNANQGLIEAFIHDYPLFGFFSVAIMAPLIEELVFRFLLCKPIEQKKKWVGIAVSGFMFGAIHLVASVQEGTLIQDLPSLISYVGMGLVLGFRYTQSDNIASNMVAHGLYNSVSFLLIMFM